MDYENKETVIRLRLTKNSYEDIKKEASSANLRLSDFIRIKLFDVNQKDQGISLNSRFNCDHDREMMRLVVRMFIYVEQLANKSLDKETKQSIDEAAANLLKDWGYE